MEVLHRIWNSRYLTLIAGMLNMFVAGTLYNFSAYAPSFKAEMNYSQQEVSFIGIVGDIGLYVFLVVVIH